MKKSIRDRGIVGANLKLTPNQINAQLDKSVTFNNKNDEIFIAIALEIDPNWVQVGQLEKN
jgi:hypothetical protein